ncbi:MBL fold metallo-hydrolase [Subtercola lobariae]|uniref:Metallo-beta-lactamase domain-containing protein n=1 Tax=Subtercola lobariae TaxID=1588641 RepID=A0A917BH86_9MICO|nr:MBL fold metallo-hydrolase [Subtercola lobariae]GGF41703.1 hypothetical protein GCM10011399_37980 [Subtercola lobariae]
MPIIDGSATVPPEMTVRNRQSSASNCAHQPLDDQGQLQLGIDSYLIRTGNRTVLVDLGLAPDQIHEAVTGSLSSRLRAAGVEPDDVTDVDFTHLHIDHVGWSSVRGDVTFP